MKTSGIYNVQMNVPVLKPVWQSRVRSRLSFFRKGAKNDNPEKSYKIGIGDNLEVDYEYLEDGANAFK